MTEWLGNLFSGQIIELAVSLASLAMVALIGLITRWVKGKISEMENDNWRRALMFAMQEAHHAAKEAVKIVEETVVNKYKKHGEWNEEAMKEAKEVALSKMKTLVSKKALVFLERFLGKFEDWAGNMIESKNVDLKKSPASNSTIPNMPQ